MKKVPLFPKHTTNVSQTDFLRNFWCHHYESCMNEATNRNSYLSCSLCGYKHTHIEDVSFATHLFSNNAPDQ